MAKDKPRPVNHAVSPVNKLDRYVMQLFVAGTLPNSLRAIANIKSICENHIHGRYDLEIIDIYQQPALAMLEDIIAVPLLIKRAPHPEERLIGDLSDEPVVLKTLGLS